MADKLLSDFISAQGLVRPSAPPKKSMKTNKSLIQPGKETMVEDGFDYIVSKKPKPKKVKENLQGMTDGIMAYMD